jgi:inosine-uridine nucleoside N-ribohydrolase
MTTNAGTIRPRIIVDCDPGHDDMFALATAALLCDVVGITAVAGNSPLVNTERNARIARDLMRLDAVPVHSGASHPLAGPTSVSADEAHGRTGLDGPPPRDPRLPLDGDDAVSFLVERTRSEEGLWLVAIGPLTNIALALRADPTLPNRIAGLSFMGGSTTHGNITSAGEFNTYFDPEAAAEVLQAGIPTVRMFGLNVTHQVCGGTPMIDALVAAGTERSLFCAELLRFSQTFNANIYGLHDPTLAVAPMHDPCAVLGVVRPDLFEFAPRSVSVELFGTHTRGMTHVDERPWKLSGGGNVDVAFRALDPSATLALIQQAAV